MCGDECSMIMTRVIRITSSAVKAVCFKRFARTPRGAIHFEGFHNPYDLRHCLKSAGVMFPLLMLLAISVTC
eukprot:753819-Hanusia_phi.AAC.4